MARRRISTQFYRDMPREFVFDVNGHRRVVYTDERRPLLDVLREDFGLTGTKYGCGEGDCGACTVLIGNAPTRSCITAVGEVAGESIQTIEGLASDELLHPMQQVFLDNEAMQCGYCVPGHGGSETPIIAIAPAIANAVYHAVGVRCRSMPIRFG